MSSLTIWYFLMFCKIQNIYLFHFHMTVQYCEGHADNEVSYCCQRRQISPSHKQETLSSQF